MVKQTIQIFGRIKPTKRHTSVYSVDNEEQTGASLEFLVPKDLSDGFINNQRESYKFRFQKVFDHATKQEDIFENIAKPVIDSVLAGYNGTIFAYGQTGSGKTFTITGEAGCYNDRGIIPRTLSYLFECFSQDSSMVYTTHVSYLEIYNEMGYDLLDSLQEASRLEERPRVVILEDSDRNIHLRNLSLQQSGSEEEALNLLFMGDTNRMIAETPMNQASTRSHCIFTVHLCRRQPGSATVRRSKLHLVDLAGSDRVSKSGLNGLQLSEAKYINLSLHYLEQVIIALSERSRSHIPYRNSMLTSVLRDSLGGNCMTTMIATMSIDRMNIDETISTCRFAQRVALIKNEAVLNEELDPALLIARMKREIEALREELALLTGKQRDEQLTGEEIQGLEMQVKAFLGDRDPSASLLLGPDMRKIQHCFSVLKMMILDKQRVINKHSDGEESSAASASEDITQENPSPEEVSKYKVLLSQRDNEIRILVRMLKKEKKKAQDAVAQITDSTSVPSSGSKDDFPMAPFSSEDSTPDSSSTSNGGRAMQHMKKGRGGASFCLNEVEDEEEFRNRLLHPCLTEEFDCVTACEFESIYTKWNGPKLSIGKQEALEIFARDHEDYLTIEDNKMLLRQRSDEARRLGEKMNKSRSRISELKRELQLRRSCRSRFGAPGPEAAAEDEDPVEEELLQQIQQEKKVYKSIIGHLKALRTEIEYLQLLMERVKVKLHQDFLQWWSQEALGAQDPKSASAATGHHAELSAGTLRPSSPSTPAVESFSPQSMAPQKAAPAWYDSSQEEGGPSSEWRSGREDLSSSSSPQDLRCTCPKSDSSSQRAVPAWHDLSQGGGGSDPKPSSNWRSARNDPSAPDHSSTFSLQELSPKSESSERGAPAWHDLSQAGRGPDPKLSSDWRSVRSQPSAGDHMSPPDSSTSSLQELRSISVAPEGGAPAWHDPSQGGRGPDSKLSAELRALSPTSPYPVTGDAQVDADIQAFIRARQNLLKRSGLQ